MMTRFLENLGGKLAERWFVSILTPAFAFWAGGLTAWVHRIGWSHFEGWLNRQSEPRQVALLILSLLVVLASAIIVQRLDFPVLRFLEGYWPRWLGPLRRLLLSSQALRLRRLERRFQELAGKGLEHLSSEELEEFAVLEGKLRRAPAAFDQRMPTALGNILRGAERRSLDKYGLDAVVCWPRLWLLLPEDVKKELVEVRASLDTAVRLYVWGFLFFVWTIWVWWSVAVGLLVILFAYLSMLRTAEVYGELLESAFDLHRTLLYKALRWPLPSNPAEERQIGAAITAYLWRGSDQSEPLFTSPKSS